MAQEANDHVCLQHALSWLCRVSPAGDQRERLVEKCVAKCGELSLTYLSSLGIQSLAQMTRRPEAVLDLLARSDVLNCQHSMAELLATSYVNKVSVKYKQPAVV